MATTNTVTAGYNGSQAGEIFVQAFKKADTINKGCITVLPNVIGSGFLPTLTYTDGITAYSCGWNPTGTIVYNDKEVATKKYQIQGELCKDKFHQTFQAQAAGLFAADNAIPTSIQDAILLAMVDNMSAIVDSQIWQGNGSANQFAGLLNQFTADTAVIDVIFTGATSKSNVVSRFEVMLDGVIAEVEDENDLVFMVSKNVGKSYKQAQADMGLNTTVGAKEMDYLGYRVESLGGLPADTIVVARVLNLGFLTGLESDLNEVRISDDETRLDGNVRTKMTFSAGVGYSDGALIVYGRK